jgi:hypothetical protein
MGENNNAQETAKLAGLLHPFIRHADTRVAVYKNNYKMALLGCLKSTFIQTHRILGNELFTIKALKYIELYPSQSEDLNHYGDLFAEYISNDSSNIKGRGSQQKIWPALYYLAQSDYLKQCCYYADNNQQVPINAFINMPIEDQMDTLFVRQSSLFLMKSPVQILNLADIHAVNDLPVKDEMNHYLFFRNEGKVQIRALEKPIYDLLMVFGCQTNMNALDESQLEQLPILLREGWLKLASAMI